LEHPALIIIDANGLGIGVYQDLWNDGLKHAIKGQSLHQEREDSAALEALKRELGGMMFSLPRAMLDA
jgi:hypothetical protein